VSLIDTLNLWLYPNLLPHYPTPDRRKKMIGTLWHGYEGILVCTEHKDGFYTLIYIDALDCKAVVNESTIHTYYTQLTQPTEET